MTGATFDPARDLVFERRVAATPKQLWACWTQPALLEQWFCPKPWRATDAEIDARPGGRFNCIIRGPDGEEMPNRGCFLEVVPERRMVWTDAMEEGFRPRAEPFMSGVITFEPDGDGTLYRAVVFHANAETKAKHEAMGFHDGWGAAAAQLEELAKTV
jgi:uncharacterized protein YndB with AHSA1/START domain